MYCRATLVTFTAEGKRLFGSAEKTKLVSETVLALHTNVVNGRRRESVEKEWTVSSRFKVVTLKIFNMKAVFSTSDLSAEAAVLAQTPDDPERHD